MDCLIPLDSLLCALCRVVQFCVELYLPRNANNGSFGGLSTTYSAETQGNNKRRGYPPVGMDYRPSAQGVLVKLQQPIQKNELV